MGPVAKTALKASMLKYFRIVEETGEDLIVTDRNRPVFRIVRIKPRIGAAELFANVRGKIVYRGDILASTESELPEL
jgi:antitoxin (DNA-binding transcriptional repressor) of toxin-antitoxin stability system